jgi:hypothetical protein
MFFSFLADFIRMTLIKGPMLLMNGIRIAFIVNYSKLANGIGVALVVNFHLFMYRISIPWAT